MRCSPTICMMRGSETWTTCITQPRIIQPSESARVEKFMLLAKSLRASRFQETLLWPILHRAEQVEAVAKAKYTWMRATPRRIPKLLQGNQRCRIRTCTLSFNRETRNLRNQKWTESNLNWLSTISQAPLPPTSTSPPRTLGSSKKMDSRLGSQKDHCLLAKGRASMLRHLALMTISKALQYLNLMFRPWRLESMTHMELLEKRVQVKWRNRWNETLVKMIFK